MISIVLYYYIFSLLVLEKIIVRISNIAPLTRGDIISLLTLGVAFYIGFRQLKISKAQFLLAKYQTTTNMIMIIQGNLQKAISKGDIVSEAHQESLIPEAMDILGSVGKELEDMKL